MAALTEWHTAYLSVGSNMGDKLANCVNGLAALTDTGYCRLLAVSRFYQTSPVDYTAQDWFVNAVVKVATRYSPANLLDALLTIQRRCGRIADAIRFGPRVLDMDILFYDDRVIRTAALEIPHPRLHKRVFVLQPICDIDPSIVHPVLGRSVAALLASLDDAAQRVIPMPDQPAITEGRHP